MNDAATVPDQFSEDRQRKLRPFVMGSHKCIGCKQSLVPHSDDEVIIRQVLVNYTDGTAIADEFMCQYCKEDGVWFDNWETGDQVYESTPLRWRQWQREGRWHYHWKGEKDGVQLHGDFKGGGPKPPPAYFTALWKRHPWIQTLDLLG